LERIFYDDEILMVMPLCVANTFTYFDMPLYHYLLGREGQTVNTDVRSRNLGFLVKSEKQMIEFYAQHPVTSGTKDVELRNILDQRIKMLVVELLRLPYGECRRNMQDFMAFIDEHYPTYDGGVLHWLYCLSYPLCWMVYHYLRPTWAYFKVNILKR
jgi:hypothetical protein